MRYLYYVLFAVILLFPTRSETQTVSRATLREMRNGIDFIKKAEEALLLSGEGLGLVILKQNLTQKDVAKMLAGQPQTMSHLLQAFAQQNFSDEEDFIFAQQAYKQAQKYYESASTVFGQIVQKSPDLTDLYLLQGFVALSQEQLASAQALFNQAKKLGPSKLRGLRLKNEKSLWETTSGLALVSQFVAKAANMRPLNTRVPPLYGYQLSYSDVGIAYAFVEGQLHIPAAPAEDEEDIFDLVEQMAALPVAKAPPAEKKPVVKTPSKRASQPPQTSVKKAPQAAMTLSAADSYVSQYVGAAKTYVDQGQYQKAITTLSELDKKKLNTLGPFTKGSLFGVYFNVGGQCLKKQQYDLAIVAYEQAQLLTPDDFRVCYSLGICYRKKDKFQASAVALKKATELKPDFASAHFNLGSTYFKLKEYDKSLDAFRATLKIDSNHTSAQYMVGLIAWNQRNYRGAADAWDRVVTINANHKKAKKWLARARMMIGPE
jgi:tetratricopeptide (TPR) repeat protein